MSDSTPHDTLPAPPLLPSDLAPAPLDPAPVASESLAGFVAKLATDIASCSAIVADERVPADVRDAYLRLGRMLQSLLREYRPSLPPGV